MPFTTRIRRLGPVLVTLAFAALAPSAMAHGHGRWHGHGHHHGQIRIAFERIDGYASPGTPANLNRVGILKTGSRGARNVLVLNPGTSASAAYFEPLARDIVRRTHGRWAVWAVERRENLLEDHSVLDLAKEGKASTQELFDYYLGYLTNPAIASHFQSIPDASVAFAKQWGMNTEVQDLRRVVLQAQRHGRRVVIGGHSLGGSITTAYATWDFNGKAGAKGLSGLVFIDGGSGPTPISVEEANARLAALQAGGPWLTFGGIPAPFAGLFNIVGSTAARRDPDAPAIFGSWPLLPGNLKPPVPATNVGGYGFALDVKTSPPGLVAAQAHLGQLAASGDPRGWDPTGALTPIQRYADMYSGTGLKGLDGTAWYHPQRLTIDSGAVAAGNANPAQAVLDVHATHGADLSHRLRIYAFGAALGGQRVLDAAANLASQSGIPSSRVMLVNRASTYAHNDPAGASPGNDFLDNLIPYLRKIG